MFCLKACLLDVEELQNSQRKDPQPIKEEALGPWSLPPPRSQDVVLPPPLSAPQPAEERPARESSTVEDVELVKSKYIQIFYFLFRF